MGDVVPFRRKVKSSCGVTYHYPIGNHESLTVVFHALYGWAGWITLGNGRALHFNRWAGNMMEVGDGLIDLYIQQETAPC